LAEQVAAQQPPPLLVAEENVNCRRRHVRKSQLQRALAGRDLEQNAAARNLRRKKAKAELLPPGVAVFRN
jgi:hypothetical protein